MQAQLNTKQIIRAKEAIQLVGVSRAQWYRIIKNDPIAPKRIKLSANTVGFYLSDVEAWIESKATQPGVQK
jgi:predicted DNA-binding transcriptional regulator AlpA